MLGRLAAGPLSPPTSPRMSDIHGKPDGLQWDHISEAALPAPIGSHFASVDQNSVTTPEATKSVQTRPLLRTIKSFPYSLGPSSRLQHDAVTGEQESSLDNFKERVLSQGPQPTASADLPQPTFGGSAPTSPVERLTPRSQETAAAEGHEDAVMEDDEMDLEGVEQDEDGERPPMTAAELRAHKRKMKRFRFVKQLSRR